VVLGDVEDARVLGEALLPGELGPLSISTTSLTEDDPVRKHEDAAVLGDSKDARVLGEAWLSGELEDADMLGRACEALRSIISNSMLMFFHWSLLDEGTMPALPHELTIRFSHRISHLICVHAWCVSWWCRGCFCIQIRVTLALLQIRLVACRCSCSAKGSDVAICRTCDSNCRQHTDNSVACSSG
jgi:hypothetical protein